MPAPGQRRRDFVLPLLVVPRILRLDRIHRPGVLGTLVGATTVEQLDANLDALDLDLSAEHLALLDGESHLPPAMTPHSLFARFPDRPPYVRRQQGRDYPN